MLRSLITGFGLLALLAVPTSTSAATGMEFALQDDAVFVDQRWMARDTALDHAEDLNVRRIRVNVMWSRLIVGDPARKTEPETVHYDFSRIDALYDAAKARGIKLQLTVAGPAPAWATSDHKVGNRRPDAGRFGAFVRRVANHFKGRIDRYSVWNEPNWHSWLSPASRAPSLYRSLYRAAYNNIKAVDPKAKVLIGELSPNGQPGRSIAPLQFLRGLTCSTLAYTAAKRCVPLKADGFALHPYQFQAPPEKVRGGLDDVPIGALSRLTGVLDKLSARNALRTPKRTKMPLYLTEFGYLTAGHRAQSPKVRAKWLASAFSIARRNPRVRQLLQYQLVDPPDEESWHSAILNRDGSPQVTYEGLAKLARLSKQHSTSS